MTILVNTPSSGRAALPIVSRIRHGLGVVPVLEEGSALLQPGDVAVYDEGWLRRNELVDGLYCIEYQRPRSGMPYASVAKRFADNDPVRFDITREIVRVARFDHIRWKQPQLDDHWMIHPLAQVRMIGQTPVIQCSDGPIWSAHLTDMLLGPIVGIFASHLGTRIDGLVHA